MLLWGAVQGRECGGRDIGGANPDVNPWRAPPLMARRLRQERRLQLAYLRHTTTWPLLQNFQRTSNSPKLLNSISYCCDISTDMTTTMPSPQHSRASSRSKSPLSLDFSDLPPLVQPSPPSNTLIITVSKVALCLSKSDLTHHTEPC
jgi:hypothetical protein